MPVLYPSQSPINATRLRQIIGWRQGRTSKCILGLLPIFIIIVIFEASEALGFNIREFNSIIAIIILIGSAVYTGSRFGSLAGLVGSITASIYLGYIFSDPQKPFSLDETTTRSAILISMLIISLAIATGYLRERIESLFIQEQIARAVAEEQQYRLEAILDQLPIGIILTDAATKQIVLNNKRSRELLHGASTSLTSRNNSLQDYADNLAKIIDQDPSTLEEVEYQIPGKQDSGILQVNASSIQDMQGNNVSTVLTLMDITHQKEIEQRKDEFISIASHELKTPVTSLKIYLQLLNRQNIVKANNELNDIVQKANNQVNKLTNLMTDLLDVSRIQTGKNEYHMQTVSLNNLIREISSNLKNATDHKITVKGKVDQSVNADPDKIRQVVTNLVNNAVKYSTGSDKIIIQLSQDEKNVTVSVQDFGIGIVAEQQSKIFERFYQIKQSDGVSYQGLGIGLYICERIIKDHGGEIWVDSEVGKGSTFYFSLPTTTKRGK